MRALQIAATGMAAQQMRVEVISNNLSNMSTTGFDARRAEFSDLHYQNLEPPGILQNLDGTPVPTGIQLGLGVKPLSVAPQLAQGALTETNGDLDLAIEGPGYLEVDLPDGGTAFTRDGGLKRSADGRIVTSEGHGLVPEIVIPDDAVSIEISPGGEVFAYFADEAAGEFLEQITLARFANPKGLEALGDNLFRGSEASGPATVDVPGADGLGLLRQGYVENSSVDAVREVTELIEAQRAYELNAKVITAADQMMSTTSQIR